MEKLNPHSFESWTDYYWNYQYKLATEWFLPWLRGLGFLVRERAILDVGCGIGGFVAAFADAGAARCEGVEIQPFPWPRHEGVRYQVADILAPDAPSERLDKPFDLIILRDVLEHIPGAQKGDFVRALRRYAHPHTRYLVAFPPWNSPFGLHQQVHVAGFAKQIPFLSWLPWNTLRPLLALSGEREQALQELDTIVDSRLTLRGFEELCLDTGWEVLSHVFHAIRPSHELRYGWKATQFRGGWIPGLREIGVMGAAYYLADNATAIRGRSPE